MERRRWWSGLAVASLTSVAMPSIATAAPGETAADAAVDADARADSKESAAPSRAMKREPLRDPGYEAEGKVIGGTLETGVAARRITSDPAGVREVASLSPMLHLELRVRPEIELFGAMGVVTIFENGPEGRDNSVRPSNLPFGGKRVWDWRGKGRHRSAYAGITFALPTGYVESEAEAEAYEYALAGRGGRNPWEWQPRTMSLVLPAGLEGQALRWLSLGGDVAVAGMFPSHGDPAAPTMAAQAGAYGRLLLKWVGAGLRTSAVYNGRHVSDKNQFALTPFLDASLCRGKRRVRADPARTSAQCPVYALAQMNLNLDAPYGFVADDAMGIWGLQFALAWAL